MKFIFGSSFFFFFFLTHAFSDSRFSYFSSSFYSFFFFFPHLFLFLLHQFLFLSTPSLSTCQLCRSTTSFVMRWFVFTSGPSRHRWSPDLTSEIFLGFRSSFLHQFCSTRSRSRCFLVDFFFSLCFVVILVDN